MPVRGDVRIASSTGLLQYNGGGTTYLVRRDSNGDLYQVYVDASSDVVYAKSADGGVTWGSAVAIFTGTAIAVAVWYDRWSGISADLLHVAYTEAGGDDVLYRSLDLASDTLGTQTTVFAGASTGPNGALTIARARGGLLMVVFSIDGGTEDGAANSTDAGANWNAMTALADPTEGAASDQFILMPGWASDNQDMMLFFWDSSADEISRKLWDNSAATWSETSIATSMVDTPAATSGLHWAAAVDTANSRNLLVAWTAVDTANADLRCWHVTESAITEVTNVVLNSTDDQHLAGIAVSTSTEDWTVVYGGKSSGAETVGTAVNLYCKTSTDDGSTWGAETRLTQFPQNIKWLATVPRFSGTLACSYYADIATDELRCNVQVTSGRGKAEFEALGAEKVLLLRSSGGPTASGADVASWTNQVSGGPTFSVVGGAVASYVADPLSDGTGPALLVDTAEQGMTSGYDPATNWTIATAIRIRSGNASDNDTYRNLIIDENTDHIGVYLDQSTTTLHAFYGTTDDSTAKTLTEDVTYVVVFWKDGTNTKAFLYGPAIGAAEVATQANENQLTDLCWLTNVSGSGVFPALGVYGFALAAFDEALSAANLTKLAALMFDEVLVGFAAGAYTLVMAQGALALTGQALALARGLRLASAQGSYALAGQDVALRRGFPLALAQGALALGGQAVNFSRGVRLSADQGAYALAGQALALNRGRSLAVDQGAYALAGQALVLLVSRLVLAGGSYALSGQAVGLTVGRSLALAQGAHALSGQAATLLATRTVALAQGSLALSGWSVALAAARLLALAQGGCTVTGQALTLTAGQTLALAAGSLALSGQGAGLLAQRRLVLSSGALVLSGQAATLHPSAVFLALASGSYTLVGRAVALLYSPVLEEHAAATGSLITSPEVAGAARAQPSVSGAALALGPVLTGRVGQS